MLRGHSTFQRLHVVKSYAALIVPTLIRKSQGILNILQKSGNFSQNAEKSEVVLANLFNFFSYFSIEVCLLMRLYPHDMATEAWPLNKLNNQVWLYSMYFYKLCPHLMALFLGDYFATFNSLLLMEEIHFEKKIVW